MIKLVDILNFKYWLTMRSRINHNDINQMNKVIQNSDMKCPRCEGQAKKYQEGRYLRWHCLTCGDSGWLKHVMNIYKESKKPTDTQR